MPSDFDTPYLKSIGVSSSGRPILYDNEYDIIMKNEIGLYQSNYKIKYYQNGRLYLTNKRIIFINDIYKDKNLFLDLRNIDNIELYNGFMNSSPKIIITLENHNEKEGILHENKITFSWICPICTYSNDLVTSKSKLKSMKLNDNELPLCNTCGVKASYEIISKYYVESKTSLNNTQNPIDLLSFDRSKCPSCTFVNHPSMTKCEICGSKLTPLSDNNEISNISTSLYFEPITQNLTLHTLYDFNDSINLKTVKFSFRDGFHQIFFEFLKKTLEEVKDTKIDSFQQNYQNKPDQSLRILSGIHGLTSNSKHQTFEDSLLLGKSIQDLDQLMLKAKDLILLSKKYQNVLIKSSKSKREFHKNFQLLKSSKASIVNLNNIISNNKIEKSLKQTKKVNAINRLKLGKKSNNTLSKFPLFYLDELARNISEFLINDDILDKRNGLITLHELFSLYNSSRQINLISAEELYDAIMRFEILNINLKITKVNISKNENSKINPFVYVISKRNKNISITKKISNFLKNNSGLSILQLQRLHFNMNFIILKTILDNLVLNGELTIDISVGGITYWPNEILLESQIENNDDKGGSSPSSVSEISEISEIFKDSFLNNEKIESQRFKDLHDLTFL